MSNTAVDVIDTAVGLLTFLTNQQVVTAEVNAELVLRLAARLDSGSPWNAADTQSFLEWLREQDAREAEKG